MTEAAMQAVRPSAVAGTFYPQQSAALLRDVTAFLLRAGAHLHAAGATPKALIVPHAGYCYSGSTAALAYACLSRARTRIKRVVLLGPVHRVAVRGLALPGVAAFATPLGQLALDLDAAAQIAGMPQVVTDARAHAQEHSLEVQLPFLQTLLENFKLLALAVGDATPSEVAQVLTALWGGDETVIVISSDLSHFLSYHAAQQADQATLQDILQLRDSLTHAQACGATCINGLLQAARQHHLRPELLGLCNSGDSAGDKNRVVGYAAIAFMQAPSDAH